MQFWGTENIGNQDFDFGEQEKKVINSGEHGNWYSPHPVRASVTDQTAAH